MLLREPIREHPQGALRERLGSAPKPWGVLSMGILEVEPVALDCLQGARSDEAAHVCSLGGVTRIQIVPLYASP